MSEIDYNKLDKEYNHIRGRVVQDAVVGSLIYFAFKKITSLWKKRWTKENKTISMSVANDQKIKNILECKDYCDGIFDYVEDDYHLMYKKSIKESNLFDELI